MPKVLYFLDVADWQKKNEIPSMCGGCDRRYVKISGKIAGRGHLAQHRVFDCARLQPHGGTSSGTAPRMCCLVVGAGGLSPFHKILNRFKYGDFKNNKENHDIFSISFWASLSQLRYVCDPFGLGCSSCSCLRWPRVVVDTYAESHSSMRG